MAHSKRIVRRGYNRISRKYRDDLGRGSDAKDMLPWLREVQKRLAGQGRGRVLELGCGMGIPTADYFSRRHDYLGVDISDVQVRRARMLVPTGHFRRADMARLRFPALTFDAVLSFYAIIHLPLREQMPLFRRIYRWLKPGGIFAAVLGHGRWTGREGNWHGAEMFWSHADRGTYRKWLRESGFKVPSPRFIPEGLGGHNLFLCVKP